MFGRELVISIEKRHPFLILRLTGFMAQLEVYRLRSQVDLLIGKDGRFLIIDLSAIGFIDSAGIGTLSQIQAECKKVRGQLALVQPQQPYVKQSLATSALNRIIDIYPDVETACGEICHKFGLEKEVAQAGKSNKLDEVLAQVAQMQKQIQGLGERLARLESPGAPELAAPAALSAPGFPTLHD